MFADAWECQINDISVLVKEVNDVCQGRAERLVYLSLPRPGVRYMSGSVCADVSLSGLLLRLEVRFGSESV